MHHFKKYSLLSILFAASVAACTAPIVDESAADSAAAADPIASSGARSNCSTALDCRTDQMCQGIPTDRSKSVGKCRPKAVLPGDSEVCSAATLCGSGLRCNGLSTGSEGLCRPDWMSATYTGRGGHAASSVVAFGLATVPEDIVVTAKLSTESLAKATLTLTDPNGAIAVLCSPSAPCTRAQLAAGVSVLGISRDDEVNGRWTLQVSDTNAQTIRAWSLGLSSRFD
jgi:Proprotein convertase P-domain